MYTDGADDSRGCSTCSCALSVGGVCSASATTFDEQQCAGSQTAQAFSGNGCDDSNTVGAASLRVDIALAPGSCAASGGAPEGEVTGRDPITVCCTPPL